MINEACAAIIVFHPIALKLTPHIVLPRCELLPCIAISSAIIVVWQIYRRRPVLGLGSYHTQTPHYKVGLFPKNCRLQARKLAKKLIQVNGSDCKFSSNFFSLAKIARHIGHGRVTVNCDEGKESEDED